MTDKTRQPPQGALASRLKTEFMTIASEIMGVPLYNPHQNPEDRPKVQRPFDLVSADPDFANFVLEGFDPTPEGGFLARYSGTPFGQRDGFEGYTYPERHFFLEVIARILEVRSRRMGDDGLLAPIPADWAVTLKARYPKWLKTSFSHGSGWADLQDTMCTMLDEKLDAEDKEAFRFEQIKEKFGGLRAYNSGFLGADPIIDTFENISEAICEECGAPGHLRDNRGWISTRCDDHAPDNRK